MENVRDAIGELKSNFTKTSEAVQIDRKWRAVGGVFKATSNVPERLPVYGKVGRDFPRAFSSPRDIGHPNENLFPTAGGPHLGNPAYPEPPICLPLIDIEKSYDYTTTITSQQKEGGSPTKRM